MKYSKIATVAQIGSAAKTKINLGELTILLVNIDGTFYAIDNKCPHMGGSLYEGNLDGQQISCPRHKTVFSVKTGAVVTPGKMAFIKVNPGGVASYPIKIEGDDILIGLNE